MQIKSLRMRSYRSESAMNGLTRATSATSSPVLFLEGQTQDRKGVCPGIKVSALASARSGASYPG